MDYNEFLPYINDSVNILLKNFNEALEIKTTPQRRLEISEELKIYFNAFKRKKLNNPDIAIDDHVGAILYSYMINPQLDIKNRDAHYNGCWYALWGTINKEPVEKIKKKCASLNPQDKKWTEICLMAIEQYYNINKNSPKKNFYEWVNEQKQKLKNTYQKKFKIKNKS